jgi:hypothetical protein
MIFSHAGWGRKIELKEGIMDRIQRKREDPGKEGGSRERERGRGRGSWERILGEMAHPERNKERERGTRGGEDPERERESEGEGGSWERWRIQREIKRAREELEGERIQRERE